MPVPVVPSPQQVALFLSAMAGIAVGLLAGWILFMEIPTKISITNKDEVIGLFIGVISVILFMLVGLAAGLIATFVLPRLAIAGGNPDTAVSCLIGCHLLTGVWIFVVSQIVELRRERH